MSAQSVIPFVSEAGAKRSRALGGHGYGSHQPLTVSPISSSQSAFKPDGRSIETMRIRTRRDVAHFAKSITYEQLRDDTFEGPKVRFRKAHR